MSEQKSFDIDSRKLFNLGANLLIAGFMQQKPEEAKKLYKDLKQASNSFEKQKKIIAQAS